MDHIPALSSLPESQRLIGASRLHQLNMDVSQVLPACLSALIVAAAQLPAPDFTQLKRERANSDYPLQDDELQAYLLAPVSPEMSVLLTQQHPGQAAALPLDRISLRQRWRDMAKYEQHHSLAGLGMKMGAMALTGLIISCVAKVGFPLNIVPHSTYVGLAIGGLTLALLKTVKDQVKDMNTADQHDTPLIKPLVLKNLGINNVPVTATAPTAQAVTQGLQTLSPDRYPLLRRLSGGDLRACLGGTAAEREAILKRKPPQIMDELKVLRQEQGGWAAAAWEAFAVLRNKDAFIQSQVAVWSQPNEASGDLSDFSSWSPALHRAVRDARASTLGAACLPVRSPPASPSVVASVSPRRSTSPRP